MMKGDVSNLDCPDRFFKWMVKLEAEAILLGRSLNQLACTEKNRAHPVIRFGGLINQKYSRLQGTPQLGPAL